MKKIILCAFGLLAVTPAFASGRLFVQGYRSFEINENKIPSMVGIDIYENVLLNVYFENFSGYSNNMVEDFALGKNVSSKSMFHVHFGKLRVGAGFQFVKYIDAGNDYRALAQISYNLW